MWKNGAVGPSGKGETWPGRSAPAPATAARFRWRPLAATSSLGGFRPARLRGLRGFLTLLGFLERLWLATDMRPESGSETWFDRLRVIGCVART